jgi:hypothetical protein
MENRHSIYSSQPFPARPILTLLNLLNIKTIKLVVLISNFKYNSVSI